MAKANLLKGGWKIAVQSFIEGVVASSEDKDEIALEHLDTLAITARKRKTEQERGKTWYETIRDRLVSAMLKAKIYERFANSRTFYKLIPDVKMGSDDAGKKKYDLLVEKYGEKWVKKHVKVSKKRIPAKTEVSYEFLGKGETAEMIEWTSAMGNKPSLEIGPPPKRAKKGEARRKRKVCK